MKPLNQLNYQDKCQLLFDLFPKEVPTFFDFAIEINIQIIADNVEGIQPPNALFRSSVLSHQFALLRTCQMTGNYNNWILTKPSYIRCSAAFFHHCFLKYREQNKASKQLAAAIDLFFNLSE